VTVEYQCFGETSCKILQCYKFPYSKILDVYVSVDFWRVLTLPKPSLEDINTINNESAGAEEMMLVQ
jgi:hypothetical protein